MQCEHNSVLQDVKAASEESSESEVTLGEILRSLDVEIGSADDHDDSADRQGPVDSRTRRTNVSLGNTASVSGIEASLHSITKVYENQSQEAGEGDAVQDTQHDSGSGSAQIDPAFLDALPEELHVEVHSGRLGSATQPSNTEAQKGVEIDLEFLAALPPDIRAEVLVQKQAQGVQRTQELDGQPVEMDTVSIIATFPSEIREEVLLTSSDAVCPSLQSDTFWYVT